MLFAPEGFAHGFLVLSEVAEFQYKCSDFYAPEDERGIAWDDPDHRHRVAARRASSRSCRTATAAGPA